MANSAYIAEFGICFQAQHTARTDGGRLIQEALSELGSDGRSEKIADNVNRFNQMLALRRRVHDTKGLLFRRIEAYFFAAIARNA